MNPTSALSPKEIDSLFKVVERLKSEGVGIIYVSHKLEEIFRLSKRITVFRDGQLVGVREYVRYRRAQTAIGMMVGREMSGMFPNKESAIGDVLLEVTGLTTEKVSNLNFSVLKKEKSLGFRD